MTDRPDLQAMAADAARALATAARHIAAGQEALLEGTTLLAVVFAGPAEPIPPAEPMRTVLERHLGRAAQARHEARSI